MVLNHSKIMKTEKIPTAQFDGDVIILHGHSTIFVILLWF